MLKRIINKVLFSIYGEDVLITKEGWSYLNDPVKRVKLREWIEIYHKTGVWDYFFWDESKYEKLNQSDVIKNEVAVCVSCKGLGGHTLIDKCDTCNGKGITQTVL